MPHKSLVTVRN